LADYIGNYEEVIRKEFPKIKIKEYELRKDKIRRMLGINSQINFSEKIIFKSIIEYFSNFYKKF